jgi:hypothetical protein
VYGEERDVLVGVPGVHGFGAVRMPQSSLGDTPKPTNVKVGGAKLPTTRAKPPTFKGTRDKQVGLPGDDPLVAFIWSNAKQTWSVITRAEGLAQLKKDGYKVPAAPAAKPAPKVAAKPAANPFADVSSGSSTTAKTAAPPKPPTQAGTHNGQLFIPRDVTQHAWKWNAASKQWQGVSRASAEAEIKTMKLSTGGTSDKPASLLEKIVSAVTPKTAQAATAPKVPSGPTGPKVAPPPAAPTRPGAYEGEMFLPSNPAEHAWQWNATLRQWQGIPRSQALKPTAAQTQAQKDAAAEASRGLIDKLTGGAVTFWKDKLIPKAPAPAPDVLTIASDQSGVPAGWVRMSNGKIVRQPTNRDPDADGQTQNGKPAPPPTPGVPGTYPSTAKDPNGDGFERPGVPAQPPTVGVPGTFPSTSRDPNGDGIDDSTGRPAVAPVLGQKGAFPVSADDRDGDGLNDQTGLPLNAGAIHEAGLGGMILPVAGVLALVLITSSRNTGRRNW